MAEYKSTYTGQEIDAGIAKAYTAVQPEDLGDLALKDTVDYETEVTNKPTIPTVDVDKNYVDTELAKKQNKITSENKLDYSLLDNTPTIPSEVTESTVAGWGFTKNTGDYTKPASGIPETDLSQAVQTILEKANATNLSTYEFNETDLGPTVLNYIVENNPDLLKVTTQQGDVQDYYKGQDRQYYCLIGEYFMVLTIEGSDGSYNLDVKSYNFDDIKEVSGTDDGTNWTSITIDGTTKNIPTGGGTTVVANPTLVGTEPELEGITIGNTDYAVKGVYPTDLTLTTEGQTIIVHKDTEIGDSSKTKSWATNVTTGQSWWLTNIPAFKEVIGKPLNSISAFFNSTGTLTLNQADIEIDCASNDMLSQAVTADANASVFITLTISSAEADGTKQTFLLDGTDSRVTFGSGVSTHPICPKTIGIARNGGPKVGFNNNTYAVENTSGQTILSGFSQQSSIPPASSGYYQSFMFFFNYDDTVTEEVAVLDLELSDNTTLSCDLSDLAIKAESSKPLKGKYLSLIGDSITTYATYKPDSSYNSRYPAGVIQNVEQTWWKQLANYTEMNILRNTAYNGSTVTGRSDTSGNGHSTSSTTDPYAGCSDKRINDLSDGVNNPDIVICYIGINDFGTNRNTPTGNYNGLSAVPADSSTGMATFTEGYGLMIKKIMAKYPETKVYCCTLPSPGAGSVSSTYVSQYGASAFPVYNSTSEVHIADYNNAIRTLAHNMGAGIIEFAETVNWWNTTTYIEDGVHPNIEGMKLLARKAIATLTADAVKESTSE